MVHIRLLGINSLMQPACNSRSNRRRRRRFFIIFMTHFHGPARAEGAQRPFKRLVNDEAAEVCAVRSAPLYSTLLVSFNHNHGALARLAAPICSARGLFKFCCCSTLFGGNYIPLPSSSLRTAATAALTRNTHHSSSSSSKTTTATATYRLSVNQRNLFFEIENGLLRLRNEEKRNFILCSKRQIKKTESLLLLIKSPGVGLFNTCRPVEWSEPITIIG